MQNFIRQVLQTSTRSVERDETALAFSQKTVLLLFKTTIQLGRELYVLLLQKLCETWPNVAKEATDWLLYAEDEVSHYRQKCAELVTDCIMSRRGSSTSQSPWL